MTWINRYVNLDLTGGLDDGTSEANAFQTVASLNASGLGGGYRFYWKRLATPYAHTGTTDIDVTLAGTDTNPQRHEAYETTPGDGGIWDAVSTDGSTGYIRWSGAHVQLIGFRLEASGANQVNLSCVSSYAVHYRTSQHGGAGGPALANTFYCFYQVAKSGYQGFSIAGGNKAAAIWYAGLFLNQYGSASTKDLVVGDWYSRGAAFAYSVFRMPSGGTKRCIFVDRINNTLRPLNVVGCRFSGGVNGLLLDEVPTLHSHQLHAAGNHYENHSGYGCDSVTADAGWLHSADDTYHACTSGFSGYGDWAQHTPIALTANPYNDDANEDLEINNAAGGGAVLRSTLLTYDPTA